MANVPTFKCDGCGHEMDSRQSAPNFTVVPGPAPANWVVSVLSCSNCAKPIGVATAPMA
jgi:ssDNA-binding Zn-finger/Zn-ribbon topoisomerase 1